MALSARTLVKLGVDKRTAQRPRARSSSAAMRECDITTKARAEMFLAQLFHESIMLSTFEEIASGAAYEGRKDLGNVQRGDGVRFKGRGPIQVTGRANYKWMSDKLGADFVAQPKLLATRPLRLSGRGARSGRARTSTPRPTRAISKASRARSTAPRRGTRLRIRRGAWRCSRASARSTCGPAARTCAAATRATPCSCSRAGSRSSSRR